jgi:hypothetical protein
MHYIADLPMMFLRQLTRIKPLRLYSVAANAPNLPLNVPIEEERKPDYNPEHFYPVKLGEVFRDTYEVAVKVGFGATSTVWLARNVQRCVFAECPV